MLDIEMSVIVCVRNGADVIGRQLAALDAQEGDVRFEIIVVDNGSTDGTANIVRSWWDGCEHAAERMSLVDGGSRPGIPHARNLGVEVARGQVVAFCDADDQVDSDWVRSIDAAMDEDLLIGGRIVAVSRDGSSEVFGDGLIATSYLPHVGGANFAVARKVFEAVGGFDESLPPYGFDDVDFSWRVQEAGFEIRYAPEARVNFTLSGSTASLRKRFLLGRGRVLMANRFPRYDTRDYTVKGGLAGFLSACRELARSSVRKRSIDMSAASRLVASVGNLDGALRYYLTGYPERQLVTSKPTSDNPENGPTIAIATNNGDLGGGEVILLEIAGVLRALGFRPVVVAPSRPSGLLTASQAAGFDSVTLPASGRLGYILHLFRWRVCHLRTPLWCNGLVPSVATAGMGPRLVHLHIIPTGINAAAAKVARVGARKVLVPSRFMAREIPGTTVLENWTPQLPMRKRALGAASGQPLRIGFLGRLIRGKGVHLLAEAVRDLVLRDHADVRLVLAGENRFGSPADDQALVAALRGIEGRTERLGWTSREAFFEQVDLVVFPSVVRESFGLVAAEAMAAGVPFVISDAGGLPEVAGPAHPWVARHGDAQDLVRVLREAIEALQNPETVRPVIAQARARWEGRYCPEQGTVRVASMLASLADEPSRGRP